MGLAELKIKIRSLAAEIAMIHADERKYERRWRQARARIRALDGEQLSHRAIRQALDQPAVRTDEDLRYVFNEAFKARRADIATSNIGTREQNQEILRRNQGDHMSLAAHRDELRAEFRCALLAYALLRGRPYSICEVANTRVHPNWDRVQTIAFRFQPEPRKHGAEWKATWEAWFRDAKAHLGLEAAAPPVDTRRPPPMWSGDEPEDRDRKGT